MNRRTFSIALTGAALSLSATVLAHHGRATIFDMTKETTVKGTITEFLWSNPHVQVGIDAVDAKGTHRHWFLEMSSTSIMTTKGWSRKSLKVGDTVTVVFHAGLRGAFTGDLLKVIFADGKQLTT
jgi:Family of unknown function (DUF6152)